MIIVYLLIDFCVCGMYCYVFFILLLPCDNLVNDVLLLTCSPAKIYTSGLYALVSHQVCQKGYVIKLLQEVLGVSMTERMWIYYFGIKTISYSNILQLLGNYNSSTFTFIPKIRCISANVLSIS